MSRGAWHERMEWVTDTRDIYAVRKAHSIQLVPSKTPVSHLQRPATTRPSVLGRHSVLAIDSSL